MSWEDSFKSWATPPGTTEQQRCDNAVTAVRKAIDASSALKNRSVSVFAQGSYRNRTNVKADSDVDVCVLCSDSLFSDLPEGMANGDFGLKPADYLYPQYKNDVETALRSYFGKDGVTRGNKAFNIHENTYRIDADAVPCFEHRRYVPGGSYLEGVAFVPDKGTRINNWPEQNYANGVQKNKDTEGRFKDLVRILKRLRNKMAEEKIAAAEPIASFLIECLVWNVPNEGFGHDTYEADVRWVLAHLFNNTKRIEDCKEWGEVNEYKYLFRPSQPWTLEQVHGFISAAWDYVSFK
jgi:hypothetical protein